MVEERAKLLVADDDVCILRLMGAILGEDHTVLFATSGEKALHLAATAHPDLILMDVTMPGIDGFEACRRLKSDPATRDIPVLFVTSHIDPAKEVEGLDAGAVDYITKPISPAVVSARVKTQLKLLRAAKHLAELNESLERRVEQRRVELEETLGELQRSQEMLVHSEAQATLSTLVASFTHELRTPIGNSVLSVGYMMEQAARFSRQVDEGHLKRSDLAGFVTTLREGFDLTQRNLLRTQELLHNFGQVSADQASEQRRGFDLAATVAEVVGTLAPRYKRLPHRIDLEIPGGIAMDSYPGALGQVVINLVNNAYLHAFEGIDCGVLSICGEQQGDTVRLKISDNGVGIPAQHLPRLFQPFFSTRIGRGGTGLGMTIVDNLVKTKLGGNLAVSSTVGVGTRFDIELPLVVAPLAAQS
ncbi:MAG TPA: hybrid sensor histidine kinase/response regulator [Rhodocyclaceae bacterium]|nr:hybrid sensor histidine kinase/response regulator [Rhodocyclaceae bacterium]